MKKRIDIANESPPSADQTAVLETAAAKPNVKTVAKKASAKSQTVSKKKSHPIEASASEAKAQAKTKVKSTPIKRSDTAPQPRPRIKPKVLKQTLVPAPEENPASTATAEPSSEVPPKVEETLASAAPPVLDEAELWDQASPIKNRLAQLKTRNALLEEQLQRFRPPVHVRGKKK